MEDNSVDSIVTDPPYGLSFMGKKWDYDVPSVEIWQEALRVLKPGGHLLSFAGTRTQHRMCVNIEDAGFEIRDMIAWVYGSGFPKSHNIGKAVDKLQGNEREVVGKKTGRGATPVSDMRGGKMHAGGTVAGTMDLSDITKGNTPYEGWGTALKPALEPITVARKPFKGTVANNVLEHGTGGINIDGCRVGERFPANLIHDGSDEVKELTGEAARFFYCAKASKKDRNEGCEGMEEVKVNKMGSFGSQEDFKCPDGANRVGDKGSSLQKNHHPTVKPTALMQYLVRLVTPPNGIVLDPFMGSGSTGKACMLEVFDFIGIEMEEEYIKIAEKRIRPPDQQSFL